MDIVIRPMIYHINRPRCSLMIHLEELLLVFTLLARALTPLFTIHHLHVQDLIDLDFQVPTWSFMVLGLLEHPLPSELRGGLGVVATTRWQMVVW
jgi:hypothetical protein